MVVCYIISRNTGQQQIIFFVVAMLLLLTCLYCSSSHVKFPYIKFCYDCIGSNNELQFSQVSTKEEKEQLQLLVDDDDDDVGDDEMMMKVTVTVTVTVDFYFLVASSLINNASFALCFNKEGIVFERTCQN
jgi:hypothetical protein